MDRWGAPADIVDEDCVIIDASAPNFTSLGLDAEGNPERATPEDTDDWASEDFAS
jgi:hypothetical protein